MRLKFDRGFFIMLGVVFAVNGFYLYMNKVDRDKAYVKAGLSEYNNQTGKLERVRPMTLETIMRHGVLDAKE